MTPQTTAVSVLYTGASSRRVTVESNTATVDPTTVIRVGSNKFDVNVNDTALAAPIPGTPHPRRRGRRRR